MFQTRFHDSGPTLEVATVPCRSRGIERPLYAHFSGIALNALIFQARPMLFQKFIGLHEIQSVVSDDPFERPMIGHESIEREKE